MGNVKRSAQSAAIAELNDQFRTNFVGGNILITAGVQALGTEFVAAALSAVRKYDDFTIDNDPYREHDFGSLKVNEHKLFWKIDYYDPSMEYGSEDPSNAQITRRILTIMLAEEY